MTREPLGAVRWPVSALVGLTLLVLTFTIAGAVLAFGGLLDALPEDVLPLVQTAVLALQYALPIALVAFLGRLRRTRFSESVLLRRFSVAQGIGLAVGVAVTARFFNAAYSIIVVMLGIDPQVTTDVTQLFADTALGALAVVVLAVFIAPLAEEIMFRGVLYPGLRDRFNPYAAAVVSSLLFAVFHGEPFVFLPIFVLGLMLAWLTETTRSVWPAIVGHAAFNATAVALLYLLRFLPDVPLP
ncbi:MAG: type II CAAX endopeptidase family protein [Coriobacteriia bacterium]|nr:type II CAAX endopeptidase family protein [Coriobacteriia bacterium]